MTKRVTLVKGIRALLRGGEGLVLVPVSGIKAPELDINMITNKGGRIYYPALDTYDSSIPMAIMLDRFVDVNETLWYLTDDVSYEGMVIFDTSCTIRQIVDDWRAYTSTYIEAGMSNDIVHRRNFRTIKEAKKVHLSTLNRIKTRHKRREYDIPY